MLVGARDTKVAELSKRAPIEQIRAYPVLRPPGRWWGGRPCPPAL